MTTDPFNTADTYHDEMPHHLADHCEHAGVGKACRRCRRKFDAASQWTRDYLAAQEPTEEEVEAASRAISAEQDRRIGLKAGAWWGGAEYRRNFAREDARAALSAARAARRDEEDR